MQILRWKRTYRKEYSSSDHEGVWGKRRRNLSSLANLSAWEYEVVHRDPRHASELIEKNHPSVDRDVRSDPLTVEKFESIPESSENGIIRWNRRQGLTVPQRWRLMMISHMLLERRWMPECGREIDMNSFDKNRTARWPNLLEELERHEQRYTGQLRSVISTYVFGVGTSPFVEHG